MKDDDVADHVLELADVAGPGIGPEYLFHIGVEAAEALALLGGVIEQELMGDRQDVVLPLAQRQVDRDDVQPVVKVLAEAALLDLAQRVAVGSTQDAQVDLVQLGAADLLEGAGLDEAEQLGLKPRLHLADLVQEQGAAIGPRRRPSRSATAPVKAPSHGRRSRFPSAPSGWRRS